MLGPTPSSEPSFRRNRWTIARDAGAITGVSAVAYLMERQDPVLVLPRQYILSANDDTRRELVETQNLCPVVKPETGSASSSIHVGVKRWIDLPNALGEIPMKAFCATAQGASGRTAVASLDLFKLVAAIVSSSY